MCRSLWQTPAALTLISTWVPDGCGVGSSTSCNGARKSVTLKLFIASLPSMIPVVIETLPRISRPRRGQPARVRWNSRFPGEGGDLGIGKAALPAHRDRVFAQRRRPFARADARLRHSERRIHHLEDAAVVLDLRQRAAMRDLRSGQGLGHRAIGRTRHPAVIERGALA